MLHSLGYGIAFGSRLYFGKISAHSFYLEVSPLSTFCSMCRDEICNQHLAKGSLMIKEAQTMDPSDSSDFISVLVAKRKRL